MRQAANGMPRTEPVRAKDTSPGRTALGFGSPISQPRNGAKDARGLGFFRPVPGLTSCARFPVLAHWAILLRPSDLVAEESSRPAKKTKHSNTKRHSRKHCTWHRARRAKDTSPGRTALGPGRQLTSPGTGRKMHPSQDSYAPFRG